MKEKGSITIPTAANDVAFTEKMIELWGADAIRDCDGTKLPDELLNKGYDVYSTYFLSRHHNEFAKKHREELQQFYFLSEFKTAFKKTLKIVITEGFAADEVLPNCDIDIGRWWEVIDRTTNEVVSPSSWSYDKETQTVTIENCKLYHEYTVTFMAYSIWDSTQMYNYIVNDWQGVEHDLPFDIRLPNSEKYIYETLDKWLKEHPDVDVVRFTTFFYHFTLVFNQHHKKKLVDWTGYNLGISVAAMEAFKEAKGYYLRPEDLVDEGYYNSQFRVPKKAFLDYVDFLNEFVCGHAKKIVDMVHKAGKKAMMFVGDNWIGIEPHSERFKSIGLDYVVTSVGSGVTERILADIKGVPSIEGRFLPYFFPDVFYEGGNPLKELNEGWLSSRRAMMRSPLDRIGFGGYLDLVSKFPDFVERLKDVCDEFRCMKKHIGKNAPF
ncbi:MAG: 1,3-beta-galactosyl-N-acetylhexosamine phosphorylase, partial [Candidatus Scatosoma sp.]